MTSRDDSEDGDESTSITTVRMSGEADDMLQIAGALAEVVAPFLEQGRDTSVREMEIGADVERERIALEKHRLTEQRAYLTDFNNHGQERFKILVYTGGGLLVMAGGIAVVLIFQGHPETAKSLLTHLGTAALSVVAGMGIQKRRNDNAPPEE